MERGLIEQAQAGDREAFGTLARSMADGLFAVAWRILREIDLAEDAVQQTLVTAWRELPRLRDVDRFEAWLRRILVRNCYAESTRRRRHAANVRVLGSEPPSPSDAFTTVAMRDEIERGFRRLPADQRAILVMHHYLELSAAEIAETLGIPPGTVRSRLHYAHRGMRAALEADARVPGVGQRPA